MRWFDDLPGVAGYRPLDGDALRSWPDRAMDDRLHHLRHCPVALPELYQIARHFPLTIRDDPDGPMVMAALDADTLRQPAFDADGRFLRSYRPMVTRLLPFCTTADGAPIRLVDHAAPAGPERPAALQVQVTGMLRAQGQGIARLSQAARLLARHGLIARADGLPGEWRPVGLDHTPPPADLAADMPAQPLSFLALRVLAVIAFSAMHRRDQPRPDAVHRLLTRDADLRRRVFLVGDSPLDFSTIPPLRAATPDDPQT